MKLQINNLDTAAESISVASVKQANNPLHGITLEALVTNLITHFGWSGLAERIPVRCFINDPSIASTLKFLRQTPWARNKIESLYILMLKENKKKDSVEF